MCPAHDIFHCCNIEILPSNQIDPHKNEKKWNIGFHQIRKIQNKESKMGQQKIVNAETENVKTKSCCDKIDVIGISAKNSLPFQQLPKK